MESELENEQSLDSAENAVAESSSDQITIALDESLDKDTASELLVRLQQLDWQQLKTLTLDGDDLDFIDFVGMQVLCSLKKTCEEKNVELGWEDVPICLFQVGEELSLSKAVGL